MEYLGVGHVEVQWVAGPEAAYQSRQVRVDLEPAADRLTIGE